MEHDESRSIIFEGLVNNNNMEEEGGTKVQVLGIFLLILLELFNYIFRFTIRVQFTQFISSTKRSRKSY